MIIRHSRSVVIDRGILTAEKERADDDDTDLRLNRRPPGTNAGGHGHRDGSKAVTFRRRRHT